MIDKGLEGAQKLQQKISLQFYPKTKMGRSFGFSLCFSIKIHPNFATPFCFEWHG